MISECSGLKSETIWVAKGKRDRKRKRDRTKDRRSEFIIVFSIPMGSSLPLNRAIKAKVPEDTVIARGYIIPIIAPAIETAAISISPNLPNQKRSIVMNVVFKRELTITGHAS